MAQPIINADERPDFGMPLNEEVRAGLARASVEVLAELAEKQRRDPVMYGWRLPAWDKVLDDWASNVVLVTCGGNRSGKSKMWAKVMLHLAATIPGFKGRAWSMNEESSINDQQRVIWEELPVRYKELGGGRAVDHSVNYTQKNGFTGSKLILPPVKPGYAGSEIIFQTYKSWQNDAQVAEGWWAHFIWLDEEAPQKLLETLVFRTYDAKGRIGLSFTTLNGWTPLVADLLNGAKTTETRAAPLVGGRRLPVRQTSRRARCVIHFFWTQDNPFINHEDFLADLSVRSEAEKLARAYGIPTRSKVGKFPLFNREVHVVKHEDIPVVKNPAMSVTWYTSIDPAGSKPWCMGWAAADAGGKLWVVREWPDRASFGEWVDPTGGEEGKPGEAQKSLGYGIKDYVDTVRNIEKDELKLKEEYVLRCIDPRMGASEVQGEDGAETIISRLDDHGLVYQPAPGKAILDGEMMINDFLAYDPKKPVGVDNAPKIYISDRCEQLIAALETYTGSGKDEPSKDPVDWLRYMLQSGVDYMEQVEKRARKGGSGY